MAAWTAQRGCLDPGTQALEGAAVHLGGRRGTLNPWAIRLLP